MEQQSVSELAGLPASTAPSGAERQPRSLVAEGSNYTRPLRRGLRWWGFVQAQYQQNQLSEDQLDPDGASLNQNEFSLRRARLRIDRGWENAFATLEIDGSTYGNGPNVRVRRAEASLLYRGDQPDDETPLFVLTAGVTDVPFGAELGESQRDRLFMERSFGSLALFANEADLGVKAWGAYKFLNYSVALVNGEPLGKDGFPTDPNTDKDVAGHFGVVAQPLEKLGVSGGVSFYTGKGFSPGKPGAKEGITWIDINSNNIVDPGEIAGVTASAPIASRNFDRWAVGLDLGLVLETGLGVSRLGLEAVAASNLDRTVLPSNPVTTGADSRQLSFTANVIQQITGYGIIGVRGAYYDPNSDLFESRSGQIVPAKQEYWVVSPVAGLTLEHGRIVAQYDFVFDQLGRDQQGAPTDVANDQFTVRLQVDL